MSKYIGDLSLEKLKAYKPDLNSKPLDFDTFWHEEKVKLNQVQFNVTEKVIDYPVKSVEAYELQFTSWDGTPMKGIVVKPKSNNPVPLLISFHGYTGSRGLVADYLKWCTLGCAVISFDVRGQGDSPDYAKYTHGSRVQSWMVKGIYHHDNYYYTNVYRDILVQLRWIFSEHFLFDVKEVGAIGASQGGGLALVAAALEEKIEFVISDWPFLTYFDHALQMASEGPYVDIVEFLKWNDPENKKLGDILTTLNYVDVLHFCNKVKQPTLMAVGLEDLVTPPSTIFAAYNHLQTKKIFIYPQYGHEVINEHEEKKIAFVAEQIR